MHTPTPYHVGVDTDLVVNEKCLIVADCGRGFRDDNCDNAAFIVRACNAHDALVEALEACVCHFDGYRHQAPVMDKARAALELARKGDL